MASVEDSAFGSNFQAEFVVIVVLVHVKEEQVSLECNGPVCDYCLAYVGGNLASEQPDLHVAFIWEYQSDGSGIVTVVVNLSNSTVEDRNGSVIVHSFHLVQRERIDGEGLLILHQSGFLSFLEGDCGSLQRRDYKSILSSSILQTQKIVRLVKANGVIQIVCLIAVEESKAVHGPSINICKNTVTKFGVTNVFLAILSSVVFEGNFQDHGKFGLGFGIVLLFRVGRMN